MEPVSASTGARARVRAELTTEIKELARRHIAEHGPDGLSLRAVARDLGLVSSALYRYFPSRDDLLTALIVDAYSSIGEAAEVAESSVRRSDLMGRWLAATRATRRWALAHPHEWALIFGSPVPDYRAPTDTVDPAARLPFLLLAIAGEAARQRPGTRPPEPPMPRVVHGDLRALRDATGTALTDAELARAIAAWTALVGSISFELFGHLHNVITDYDAFFRHQMRTVGIGLGLARS
ncbi:MAG: TetR/AcrR family transcriptional regulator [Acidimicrobiales bacterium]